MKTFHLTLPDSKYSKPREDAWAEQDGVFCVADGITRDPITPLDFGDLSIEELLRQYPDPSPATQAAEVFCQSFIASPKALKPAFIAANEAIRALNQTHNPQPDYLVNDYWGCVASAAVVRAGQLHWACIGDCGVAVFSGGKKMWQTPDGLADFTQHIAHHPGRWGDPNRRRLIRRDYRNNPQQWADGHCVGYGALTGELQAETFMHFGTQPVAAGDLIVCYSDGFAALLNEPNVAAHLQRGKQDFMRFDKQFSEQDYQQYGKERTLVAIVL